MKLIEDYIYIKNYLNNNFCDNILKNIKNRKWEKHQWFDYTKMKIESSLEDADVLNASLEDQNKLLPFINQAVSDYQILKSHKELPPPWISRHSPIRFNNYKKNQLMDLHYDHIQSVFDGKEKGIPILSVVGLLNDNFEGGEFVICDKEIKLKKGDIIIFPSCFIYAHKVNPVKSKKSRYSFVCWVY